MSDACITNRRHTQHDGGICGVMSTIIRNKHYNTNSNLGQDFAFYIAQRSLGKI